MDKDFDKFLETIQEQQPSTMQIKRWQREAMYTDLKTQPRKWFWQQMIAACLIGAVVGGLIVSRVLQNQEVSFEENETGFATIEVITNK